MVDPKNINTIMEWATSNNVADIRSFLGLARYYLKFIEGFSKISFPMTSLQDKGQTFWWTTKWKPSFEKLKHLVTMTPVLKVADPKKYFVACVDESKEGGVGQVLMQEAKVIAYESSKLKEYEK